MAGALRAAREAPAPTAFAIAALAAFGLAAAQGEKFFYYDSGAYWALSETFTGSGSFPFFDFENTGIRGYVLPLLYLGLREGADFLVGSDWLLVWGFNAATFALIGTVLAPRLAAIAWPEAKWNVSRRLALTALILAFWSGYLSFPLSDFPALAAALLALVAISRADSPPWLLLAGLSAGIALNVRPAYLLLTPLLIGLLVWSWTERRDGGRILSGRRLLCAAALFGGFAIVALPQSVSQHKRFGEYSFVPGSSGLTGFQYATGLRFQRYETHVSGPPQMEYLDPHTREIVAGLENGSVGGTGGYLGIVADHPLTMAGVYLRHVVNGLDQRYTTPYVETLESDREGLAAAWHDLLRAGGFLIVFLALLRVALPAGRRSLGPARWRYPAALLAVSASAIPSAVETRFLLPAFLLAAMLVVAPGWRQALSELRAHPAWRRELALVLAAAVAYAAIVWSIVSAASDNLRLS